MTGVRDAILTAAGALLVAVLNELRARLRAREADRDRRAAIERRDELEELRRVIAAMPLPGDSSSGSSGEQHR